MRHKQRRNLSLSVNISIIRTLQHSVSRRFFFYFRGILLDSKAWLLGALVAVAYVVSYVLLQMETYAFLAGTLILFAVLAVLMYLTRKAPAGQ